MDWLVRQVSTTFQRVKAAAVLAGALVMSVLLVLQLLTFGGTGG